MSALAIIVVLAATGVVSVVLHQRKQSQHIHAVVSLASGISGLLAFSWLPWFQATGTTVGLLQLMHEHLAARSSAMDAPLLAATLQAGISSITNTTITGQWLLIASTGTSITLHGMLVVVLAGHSTALLVGALGLFRWRVSRFMLYVQVALSTSASLVLLAACVYPPVLGVRTGVLWLLLQLAGLRIGSGVWVSILALLISAGVSILAVRTLGTATALTGSSQAKQ